MVIVSDSVLCRLAPSPSLQISWPANRAERAGVQDGDAQNAWVNRIPCLATRSMLGVCTTGISIAAQMTEIVIVGHEQ